MMMMMEKEIYCSFSLKYLQYDYHPATQNMPILLFILFIYFPRAFVLAIRVNQKWGKKKRV